MPNNTAGEIFNLADGVTSASTGEWLTWRGGKGGLFITGTFDTSTVSVEVSLDGDDAAVLESVTAASYNNIDIPPCKVRCTVASPGASTDVSATIVSNFN